MTTLERLTAALADRYRLERELGQGGMATVYLAEDLKHHRKVAVKVLRPELAAALGPERFLREIETTANLRHPHILPLYDSGEAAGFLYYVMPLVDGESLRARLDRQKQLPINEALSVAREVADALGYAHQRGIIHRDIKPENVLLEGSHAVVADFGIARAITSAGAEKLTATGLSVGTPLYMSPEQAAGDANLDGRSDLYALGCVLYEMLGGQAPFTGPTAQSITRQHLVTDAPPITNLRPTVPPEVAGALARSLAKNPADRFATATEFAAALTDPGVRPLPSVTQPSQRDRHRWLLPAAIVPALTIIGVLLVMYSRRPAITPSASVIAVLPFLPSGADTALVRLGRDLALTISANLDGVGSIRTADPHQVLSKADGSRTGQWLPNAIALGKRLGAGSVVVGDIVRVGSDVRLDLKLVSTSGDSVPLARVSVSGAPDSIGALTDSVTWSVLRQVWGRGEPPSPSYANLTTRSVLSLRAFLDGERLSETGNWSAAAAAYAAAIKADSSFWLAGWRYNNTQGWLETGAFDNELARGYESHLSAFGERDRMMIEAGMSSSPAPWAEILARDRAVTERFPTDWPAWFSYADNLYHFGPLFGSSNAEVRAALQRTVDLNPKLISMWDHLAYASLGHDSVQAALAVRSLTALGRFGEESRGWGMDGSLFYRLPLAAEGPLPTALIDSLARSLAATREPFPNMLGRVFLVFYGFPAAQVELNRRLVALDPRGPYAAVTWSGTAYAWAARGAWDSALAARDRYGIASPETASPVDTYRLAVVGAWLGGVDPSQAALRRVAAAKYLDGSMTDSATAREARATLAWSDGILAALRRDSPGLAGARTAVRRSGAAGAGALDRGLGGFALELNGLKREAADSLEALDRAATDDELGVQDAFARSVNHLQASRLLLELGDTGRALKSLTWHDADLARPSNRVRFQVIAPLAYYELARIEEAQGRTEAARDHYQQFLRRYDMPLAGHKHLVDEAKAALRRLSGQHDVPHTR